MSQLVYGILAILLLAFLGMNLRRGKVQTQDRMVMNEVATELSGVAYGVLDFIGRTAFDENTDESKVAQPVTYPVITSTASLTTAGNFGGCTALALADPACDDVDDFDGLAGTTTAGGLTYTWTVTVRYVNPANPSQAAGGPSFAKEVEVEVQNPYLTLDGAPMPVSMRRVFTYNRHIDTP